MDFLRTHLIMNEPLSVDHFQSSLLGGFAVDQFGTLISLITVEVGINVEGGIFWKKLVHKCNKRGVEGGKNLRNQ
jgi:hypothetical protein